MDKGSQDACNKFAASLMQLVDRGTELMGEESVADMLWQSLIDLDPSRYRFAARYDERDGQRRLKLSYHNPVALRLDLDRLVQVQGLMVPVEPAPPLMESLQVVITGEGVDDRVEIGGRAVHQADGEVAVELMGDESRQRRRLQGLIEAMDEVSEDVAGEGSLASTLSDISVVGDDGDSDESSVTGEDSGEDGEDQPEQQGPSPVDRLIEKPEDVTRRWQWDVDSVDDIVIQLADVDGYGFLELVDAGGTTIQYVLHFGRLIDVRREPMGDDEQLLIDKLVERGTVDEVDVQRAEVLASIHEIAVQDALVDMGCMTLEELLEAIEARLVDELDRLWETDADDARLFVLDQRPPLRLRRSSVDLVQHLMARWQRQLLQISDDRLQSHRQRFCNQQVQHSRTASIELQRLGLNSRQRRFVEEILDEPRSMYDLRRISNLGGDETVRMLVMLDRLDLIEIGDQCDRLPEHGEVEGLYATVQEGDCFEILGLHWSAYDEEIEQAYRKLRQKLDVPDEVEQQMAEELAQIRRSVSEAYATLSDRHRRRAYRNERVDEFSRRSALDVYESQAKSLSMREDKSELLDRLHRIVELDPDNDQARRQLEAVRHALRQH